MKNRILHLFSGGRDSFLSSCRLLESGDNELFLATYSNGCCIGIEHARDEAIRLINKYGNNRVHFQGIYNTSGIWREFFMPIMNLKTSDILGQYGEITFSQINCLTCRISMYIYSIAICKELGISTISDGARHSQKFIIELDPMLKKFEDLLSCYGIRLVLPVVDMDSDWKRKNELLLYGFSPKTLEPQCLLGVPLKDDIPECVIQGVLAFYEKEVFSKIPDLVSIASRTMHYNTEDFI